MVHDFAKIKPEPVLEHRQVEAPPSWMLLSTGLITGVAVGVFACVLFYLSGNVPPLQVASQPGPIANGVAATVASETTEPVVEAPPELQLEFYEELQNYEVIVDAPLVEIENTAPERQSDGKGFMLQSGAFEQRASADSQLARLQALGLSSVIKQQNLSGRTLYLVQSGPFSTGDQVGNAESLLLRNNIDSIKIVLQ
jgi:cell division protein FtsN